MFRRRTFSPSGIHYRVSINKNMCPNPVDIYRQQYISIWFQ